VNDNTEVSKLLKELKNNRKDLHTMIDTISSFRDKIDTLLPEQADYRKRHLMVERMKNVTEILKSELAVRKQIDESIKLETDMRRKTEEGELGDQPQAIKAYAKAIELIYENRENKNKNEDIKPELSLDNKEN